MAEITPRDRIACIRYEFQRGTPFCDAFKNVCAVFGNDAMTFGNFEFWWYRFKEENFDLDYKGPPKPEFSDIPLDLVEEIIGKMDWKQRCLFRKVSKKCRKVVDSVPITFDHVEFYDAPYDTRLCIDQLRLIYRRRKNYYDSPENKTKSKYFMKRAFTDFACILENPKIQMRSIAVHLDSYSRRSLERFLQSLHHQIHVESLLFEGDSQHDNSIHEMEKDMPDILPYLKPGILRSIEMDWNVKKWMLDDVANLDQWKQAITLETRTCLPKNFEHIKHFHRLNVRFNSIAGEDLIQLRNIFSSSRNFQSASIWFNESERNAMQKLKACYFRRDVLIERGSNHYEISKNISC